MLLYIGLFLLATICVLMAVVRKRMFNCQVNTANAQLNVLGSMKSNLLTQNKLDEESASMAQEQIDQAIDVLQMLQRYQNCWWVPAIAWNMLRDLNSHINTALLLMAMTPALAEFPKID